jgi:serine/threonine-protein kinase
LAEPPATNAEGSQGEQPGLAPGEGLGGYVVVRELARGGMGVVYEARDVALGRPVALKVIAPALAADRVFRERFRRESQLAAQVEHPAVVPVYRAGQDRGRLFIAMRFVDGTDLATVLRDGAVSPTRTAVLIEQVASALDAAHARGLVHRDVKPANVLLTHDGERAFLSDFGLTIEIAAGTGVTRTGQWVGTLAYAAPEQVRGGDVDARTDIYALGGVLHHCLTGQVPYPVMHDVDAIAAHLLDPPPRPSAVVPTVPRALDHVVARAMSKDPAARYASAGDMAAAVSAAVAGRSAPTRERSVATGAAAPRDAVPAATPARRRRLWPAGAIAGAAALATASAVVLLSGGPRERSSPPTGRTANEAGTVVGRPIAVFDDVAHLAVSEDAVWVANQGSNTSTAGRVAHIDPRLNEVVGLPIQLPEGAGGVAIAHGSVWVTAGKSLMRIDATTGEVDAVIRLGGNRTALSGVAASGSAIWVSRSVPAGAVLRIDPKNNRPVGEPILVGREPSKVAVGEGAVWVLNSVGGTVTRINPATNTVVGKPIRATRDEAGGDMVVGEGGVWVAADEAVVRIDPDSQQVVGSPITGPWKAPLGLALSDGALWVTDVLRGTVSRVDLDSGAVVGTPIRVGAAPLDVAVGDGAVWVVNSADGTVTRIAPTP